MNNKLGAMLVTLGLLGLDLALFWLLIQPLHIVSTQGTTRYVAPYGVDDSDCTKFPLPCRTIQYALGRVTDGDVIKVAGGNYSDINNQGGLVQVVYIDKNITIRGGYTAPGFAEPPDPEANPTTLDAQDQGRVLYIAGEIDVTIEGLRITGGNATGLGGGPDGIDAGGGVWAMFATAAISRSWLFDNFADVGGGLYLSATQTTLVENIISDNRAGGIDYEQGDGGGAYLRASQVMLIGNKITGNHASGVGFYPGEGGGLYLGDCAATFNDNLFSDNYAYTGGGLYLSGGDVTFTNNSFSENTGLGGGGMGLNNCGTATLRANTFVSNTASVTQGGGMYAYGCESVLLDSNTFASNSAASSGAGAHLGDGHIAIHYNTFANNHGFFGGGLSLDYFASATLSANTLVSNTAAYGGGVYITLSKVRLVNNLIAFNNADISAGGGVCANNRSEITLDSNTILSNLSEQGGGVFLSAGTVMTVTNSIVAKNQVTDLGSGLYVDGSTARIAHATFVSNKGGDGSAVFVTEGHGVPGKSMVTLTNTVVVDHKVGITVTANNTVAMEAILWGSDIWANDTDWAGDGAILAGTINLWGDPAFVDPFGSDYHIGPGSAALDAGVDAGVTWDIDYQPRPHLAPDLGADEYWPPGTLYTIYLPLVTKNH